ncbi:MAG: glycosyltransferase family 9 protein [Bdellovibrionales bacterium]
MKVLVISLLRIGDFVQTLPVLHALRTQFPIRKLDVLTHEPAKALAPMIGDVNKWWTIDRDGMQEGLGRAEIPLLTSFSVLKERLDEINECKYDCIINLTQTHYSAWIAGYLKTGNRFGLTFDTKGLAHFHSPWFKYLDEHTPLEVKDVFHYTDIFFYGSGLKGPERTWLLNETPAGRQEVAALNLGAREKIVLQVLTSDTKKNWSEASWLKMLTQLQLFRPKAQFVLLGAPNEEMRLNSLLSKATIQGVTASKAIVSLEGAFSLLKQSRLLITGDTSIKHLANAADIPILELSLGSSDYRRTGAYKPDSLILQPVVACSPCPHSAPCSQSEHACAKLLSPEVVSTVAHHYLAGNRLALQELAKEFEREVKILRTRILASGFWMAQDINESQPVKTVEKIVERCTWKFLLNREYLNPLAQFGSEGVHIKNELDEIVQASDLPAMNQHLTFLETEADQMREKAAHLLSSVQRRNPSLGDIKEFITRYQPESQALPWLEKLIQESGQGMVEIGGLRRVHNQLEHFLQQSLVKVKLIRSLKSQLTETQ